MMRTILASPPSTSTLARAIALASLLTEPAVARAQQTQPPSVVKAPPLPNRANELLPSWLRIRAEFRERLEGFAGSGFVEGRDDLYWLSRLRLNATVQPSTTFAFTFQAQDARVGKKSVGSTGPPFRDALDLRLAYATIGNSQKGPIAVQVGRQELVFGDERLVGHVSWLNTARTFDAGRVTLRGRVFRVDVFGSSVVTIKDQQFNRSGAGSYFFGAYGSTGALVPKSVVEPYVFYRVNRDLPSELGPTGDLTAATIGVRWVGTLPARLDYNTEMAVQSGSLGPDNVRARAGHWQLRATLNAKHALRLAGEYNYASGDSNSTDGTRETFDQLYPTPHDKYGLADQVAWKNIHHVRAGLDVSPRRPWAVNGSYHSWWLAEKSDALYSAGGAQLARVAGGAAAGHVGQELDVQISRPVSPQLQISAGYAHIFPGGFLKQATPGASYSYPYVMATYVFLAEK